jgi:hypothetical protein
MPPSVVPFVPDIGLRMDIFKHFHSSLESPARCAVAVAPSDTVSLPQVTRALYVGEGGSVSVQMVDGLVATFRNVPTGSILPIRVSKIRATDTTAGGIVGLW